MANLPGLPGGWSEKQAKKRWDDSVYACRERKRGTILFTMNRKVDIIVGPDGERIVLINYIQFKGKKKEDWKEVEEYLKRYVGKSYEITDTSEKNIYPVIFQMNTQARKADLR